MADFHAHGRIDPGARGVTVPPRLHVQHRGYGAYRMTHPDLIAQGHGGTLGGIGFQEYRTEDGGDRYGLLLASRDPFANGGLS